MSGSNDTKVCRICGNGKPLDQFYKHPNMQDGHLNSCKACEVERKKKYDKPSAASKAGYETEEAVINKLAEHGIFAVPGKATAFKNVDVIAWGCIRIEVKSTKSVDKQGRCVFNFSNQSKRGLNADFVVLIPIENDEFSFYVFPSDYPDFYLGNGGLKSAAYFSPCEATSNAQNAWYLIDKFREMVSEELAKGAFQKQVSTYQGVVRIHR